jgi:hypothetical protein
MDERGGTERVVGTLMTQVCGHRAHASHARIRFRTPAKLRSSQWDSRFDVPLSTLDEFDEPLSVLL